MQEIVLFSIERQDLESIIINCVNACLSTSQKNIAEASQQDELLTIQQAAEILKLSVPTIYGLVSRTEIPHAKKGKRLYFSKQELLDWVQSGRKKTNAEIAADATAYCNNTKNKRR